LKIANSSELKDTIQKLTTPIDTPSTAISTKLDADEVNDFFVSIEAAFNSLYEKLRLLQDVHDFSKEYIQSVYDKTTKELDMVNLDSDAASQEYRNSRVKASVAVFTNSGAVRDRDGSALYQADAENSVIIPGNAVIEKADPSSSSTFSTDICYRRNPMPADNYKAFYVMDAAQEKLPEEKITFFLPEPTMVNHIDIAQFNSDIKSITLTCSNGDMVNIPAGDTTFTVRNVVAMEITLVSNKRDKIVAEVSDNSSTFTSTNAYAVTEVLDSVWDTYLAKKGDITHVLR
jgi:hypothetical protein